MASVQTEVVSIISISAIRSILTLKTKPYVAQYLEYSGIIIGQKNPQERCVLRALVKWRH